MTETPVIQRVRGIVESIASDLDLDLYDLEQRGSTLRVTIDTPPGSPSSVDLEQLALATRLISREMDHQDPIPGKYTLEVTSPGVERTLRLPWHFQREIGKTISVRLADTTAEQRRFEGVLVAADDTTATVRVATDGDVVDRVVEIASIDRARTVFVWGAKPKPGGKGASKKKSKPSGATPSPQHVPKESS
ncbi:MAG TPA: ribosome maturation factor RimP [Ilumatobacter sp.]